MRQRSQRYKGIVKAQRDAYYRCVLLFQETKRWVATPRCGSHILLTADGCQCSIAVPRGIGEAIGQTMHNTNFYAVRLYSVAVVSAYLPHSLEEAVQTMEDITKLIRRWRSDGCKHTVLGGDFNAMLPEGHSPTTGGHVMRASATRQARERKRRGIVMSWLRELVGSSGTQHLRTERY